MSLEAEKKRWEEETLQPVLERYPERENELKPNRISPCPAC